MASEVIAINDASQFKRRLGKMRKNGTRGKDRVSIEFEAEPLVHYFDARVGAPIAEAMTEVIRDQMTRIATMAAPATIRARRSVERAVQAGKSWATRRYSGGKMGATPPKPGEDRAFNHSGRLAKGLFTQFNKGDGAFTTNVPANRFSEDVFDEGRRRAAFEKMASLIPALRNPGSIFRDKRVQEATQQSLTMMIAKLRSEREIKTAELRKQIFSIGRAIAGLF